MSEFDEFDVEFCKLKDVGRTNAARMDSLMKLKARGKKKKFHLLPMIVSSVTIAVIALFLVLTLNEYFPDITSGNSIIDDQTSADIPFIEVTPNLSTIEYGLDNMDRGNHDYITIGTENKIVVDTGVTDFQRGDVVYFTTPEYSNENPSLNLEEKHISRVIGLPGEKIEIKKGQVYIDNKKLEVFYSNPTVRGMKKEEYFESVNPRNTNMTEEDFEENMGPIYVPEGSLFVLGDHWWRSIDSRHFGPISLQEVEGKVLGYEIQK